MPRKGGKANERTSQGVRPQTGRKEDLRHVARGQLLPRRARPGKEALHHRYPAPECHGPAPPRPCLRRDHPGRAHKVQAHGRLLHPLAAGLRPRRHRHADKGRGKAPRTRARPASTSGARSSSTRSGPGRTSTATASSSSSRPSAPPATGTRQRFTMDDTCAQRRARDLRRPLQEEAHLQGQPHHQLVPASAPPRSPTPRSSTSTSRATSGISATRSPTAPATSSSPRRVPRPCSATPAVAVNPNDERYKDIDRQDAASCPLVNREIPTRRRRATSTMDFGTGCVKMTPRARPERLRGRPKRHDLAVHPHSERRRNDQRERRQIRRNGPLRGEKGHSRTTSRQGGWLVKSRAATSTTSAPATAATATVEPITSESVVREDGAAREGGACRRASRTARRKFVPERFTKTYTQLDGERAATGASPVSSGGATGSRPGTAPTAATYGRLEGQMPTSCRSLRREDIVSEEPDVLDTWFSSALWPFSTLGWPENDRGPRSTSIPTDVLVTGYDIIFFWVARMIFSACEHMQRDAVPHRVHPRPGPRRRRARKMSKSAGQRRRPASR